MSVLGDPGLHQPLRPLEKYAGALDRDASHGKSHPVVLAESSEQTFTLGMALRADQDVSHDGRVRNFFDDIVITALLLGQFTGDREQAAIGGVPSGVLAVGRRVVIVAGLCSSRGVIYLPDGPSDCTTGYMTQS